MKKMEFLLLLAAMLLFCSCHKNTNSQTSAKPASEPASQPIAQTQTADLVEPQPVICLEEYQAAAGKPNSGPFRSPCRKWAASSEADNGCAAVIVLDIRTGSRRTDQEVLHRLPGRQRQVARGRRYD